LRKPSDFFILDISFETAIKLLYTFTEKGEHMNSFIFDVDGTIWDATAAVAESWKETCRKYHVPSDIITPQRLQKEFGKLLLDIGRSLFPDLPEEKMSELTHQCCDAENEYLRLHGPKAYPGIPDLFRTLSQNFPVFIVSNCQAGYIEVMLERTGLGPFVKDHLCPGDTGKAKAGNIIEIIEKHHLTDPVYIGDTLGDFNATHEAGIPFIFASYGFGEVPHPDYTIKKPLDLLNLIQ
jgi:phosphoglycolate phosphatase